MKGYDGPRIPTASVIRNVKPPVSKDKSEMVESVINTFRNFIQSEELMRTHVDTGLGSYIGKFASPNMSK